MLRILSLVAVSLMLVVAGDANAQSAPPVAPLAKSALGGYAATGNQRAGEEISDRAPAVPATPTTRSLSAPSSASPPPQSPAAPASSAAPVAGASIPAVPNNGFRMGFRNLHDSTVGLQLYSKRGDKINTWPGHDRVYVLDAGAVHVLRVNCQPGEEICYGAWAENKFWGTGPAMKRTCTGCCRVCGTDGGSMTLR